MNRYCLLLLKLVLVPILQVFDLWILLLIRNAKHGEDLLQLVCLVLAHQEGNLVYHLSHDAANAPNIDARIVLSVSKENIWGSVPQSHHFIRVVLYRKTCGSCKSKICELYDFFLY